MQNDLEKYEYLQELAQPSFGVNGAPLRTVPALNSRSTWFYREPRLVAITLILSSTFLLSGLTIQHTALLNRQMRFTALAIIQIASMLTSVVVGIVMAWLGFRYWALVFSNLVNAAVAVPLTWCAIPWRPQLPSRGTGTESLVRFGTSMAGGGYVYALAKGTDNMCAFVPERQTKSP